MMSHSKTCVLFLFSFLLLMSCAKDSDIIVGVTDNLPEVKEKIYGTFNGLILDEQEGIIVGASVMIGGESSMTDDNGFFTISGFFNPDGTPITVTKEGYFDAHGRLIPYPDVSVNTKVKMIQKNDSVKGETDKSITYDTELANVTFEENSYTIGDIKYEGIVEVIGSSINIEDPEYSLYSPGSMETVKDGKYKMILPYGRVNIELYSESGEAVNIDAPAEIKFDIAEGLIQMAPDEVPMWYLDKTSGLWIEDGMALKTGSQYIGDVNHFTDWCVGLDANLYTLTGNVTRNGQAYANANMGATFFSYRFGFKSAEDGSYSLRVFDFDNFTLDVADHCNISIYEKEFNPLSSDETHDIDITKSSNSFVVSGNIYCENTDTKVEGGYVLINFDNNKFSEVVTTNESGNFRFFYEECNNKNVTLRAYDPTENKQSGVFSISGDEENLEIDVCKEEIAGSIRIEIDGQEPYIISGCTVEITDFSDFPGIPGFHYTFRARDNFESLPNVTGEFVDYEILVNVSIPGEIQLPLGPIATPVDIENGISENAPFYYEIIPAGSTIISENDESVVLITADLFGFGISKIEGGNKTDFSGRVVLEAVKI